LIFYFFIKNSIYEISISLVVASASMLLACGQDDKSKSKSTGPGKETLQAAVVTIDYVVSHLRKVELLVRSEPMAGKVWRTGAMRPPI
jgi:hypothetical protein